jgi:hypothetical protein
MAKATEVTEVIEQTEPQVQLVKMVRDAELYPDVNTADVHPDEVENFKLGNWIVLP